MNLTDTEKRLLKRAIQDAIDIYAGFDLKGRIKEFMVIAEKLDLGVDFFCEIRDKSF